MIDITITSVDKATPSLELMLYFANKTKMTAKFYNMAFDAADKYGSYSTMFKLFYEELRTYSPEACEHLDGDIACSIIGG